MMQNAAGTRCPSLQLFKTRQSISVSSNNKQQTQVSTRTKTNYAHGATTFFLRTNPRLLSTRQCDVQHLGTLCTFYHQNQTFNTRHDQLSSPPFSLPVFIRTQDSACDSGTRSSARSKHHPRTTIHNPLCTASFDLYVGLHDRHLFFPLLFSFLEDFETKWCAFASTTTK